MNTTLLQASGFAAWYRRHWRIAELRLLVLALVVSVTAVTSVAFFTDRMDRSMLSQAAQLLGGDLVLTSSRPIDEDYLEKARALGLNTARIIEFPSVVAAGEQFQLARVRAVSAAYPLQGRLEISDSLAGAGYPTDVLPAAGEAWAEARLFVALGVSPGQTVQLGNRSLQLSRVITRTPDQSATAFQFAPNIVMPLGDLESTGLLTPASRARFSLMFTGQQEPIDKLREWLGARLKPTEKIRTIEDGLPSIQQALQRGQRFLGLASLLSVVLAGAAVALASYSFSRRETRSVAVLKTLGATRARIIGMILSLLLSAATMAALLGALAGYLVQLLLVVLLQDFILHELPAPGWAPLFTGLMTAWIMMLGFAVPQILRLVNITPVQILQGLRPAHSMTYALSTPAIIGSVFVLMWLQARDLVLTTYLCLGVLAALGLLWLAATLLQKGLRLLTNYGPWRLFRLPVNGQRSTLLIIVFGSGFFSLLLLTTLRTDLIGRWQASIPAQAPNQFLINIQPGERQALDRFLAERNYAQRLYPMTRGRLIALNGQPVSIDKYRSDRAQRLLEREFNLSSAAQLPASNAIVAGAWFASRQDSGLSVEQGIAETLALQLGDSLTFDIAGQTLTQTITSLRSVRWDSMQPNFFVLAAPGLLDERPQTYITSIHVPAEENELIPALVRKFPGVTAIDISAILQQVQEMIAKAAFAVQAIFSFTLVAGIVVLFAAMQSQRPARRREIAILKSLGANRASLRRAILAEFITLGTVAGILGGLFAMLAGNIAAYRLFDLEPAFNLALVVSGGAGGALLVGAAGYLILRPLLEVTPVALFQESSAQS